LQESAKLVEEEQWAQVEVPASSQHVVDLLVGSAMKDPLDWSVGKKADNSIPGNAANGKDSEMASPSLSSKTLRIEEQTFNTVSATLRSVVLLQDYARVVVSLDVIVSDTMNRIVEYLKVSLDVLLHLLPAYPPSQ
jgi:vacuolar protein sorting-associated protein 54